MNEDVKRRGRPPKSHLQEDHHFRTSEEVAAAGAPPADTESDQADVSLVDSYPDSASAEPIDEPRFPISNGMAIAVMDNPIIEFIESPIEEKIQQLVAAASLNGWRYIDTEIVLEMPPRNGIGVKLSEKPDGEGTLALWKKTRKFANATHRWQESGKWIDFHSGMDISFIPKYWKERYV